jgi:hypothetical protein
LDATPIDQRRDQHHLSSVCIVDAPGKIIREGNVRSEREALVGFFKAAA